MMADFRRAMMDCGLVPPERLIADGRIHRCAVEGHRRKSGAYRISPDGFWGGFENWSNGLGWQKWQGAKPSQLTPEQRAAIDEARRRLEAETRREREAAQRRAVEMWTAATEGPHPYLDRKGICSNGSRVLGDWLVVPMADWDGRLTSVQTITKDGEKKFLRGGRFHGSFHWIRCGTAIGRKVYVCEGFATGSTIHAATGGKPVCVAFACGNLLPVCRILRAHLPTQLIIVCADNDHATDGNPGVTKALQAAEAVGGLVCIPNGMDGTDFNDLQTEHGIDWVTEQLKHPIRART